MAQDPIDVEQAAGTLITSLGLLVRQLRQGTAADGGLSMPETSALSRLDRGGPTTAAALAKAEQISPQSMGATIAALEVRGLVARAADPGDGRRVVVSATAAGLEALRNRRDAKTERLARALDAELTPTELRQLVALAPVIERLAHRI